MVAFNHSAGQFQPEPPESVKERMRAIRAAMVAGDLQVKMMKRKDGRVVWLLCAHTHNDAGNCIFYPLAEMIDGNDCGKDYQTPDGARFVQPGGEGK